MRKSAPGISPPPPTKRWKRRLTGMIILLAVVVILGVGGLAVFIVRYGMTDQARPADVIIVLGAGKAGTIRRTLHAVALYQQGYAPYVICTGGYTLEEAPYNEAQWCAQVAQEHGVPATAIILEESSRNTQENAIEAAAIMRARGWQTAVLVTDDFHLWRASRLFIAEGIRVWPSPVQATGAALPSREKMRGVLHEIAATGWMLGQALRDSIYQIG